MESDNLICHNCGGIEPMSCQKCQEDKECAQDDCDICLGSGILCGHCGDLMWPNGYRAYVGEVKDGDDARHVTRAG